MTAGRRWGLSRGAVAAIAVVVVLLGAAAAWAIDDRNDVDDCELSADVNVDDTVGAASPEAARARWAAAEGLGIDAAQPVFRGGSDDLFMADYQEFGPDRREPSDAEHAVYLTMVTQLGEDGVWRVIRVSHCEQSLP